MELTIARTYRRELEKKVAELLKEYEKNTSLSVSGITFVRQPSYDALGDETDFVYAVEVESKI